MLEEMKVVLQRTLWYILFIQVCLNLNLFSEPLVHGITLNHVTYRKCQNQENLLRGYMISLKHCDKLSES